MARILIVDDDRALVNVLRTWLCREHLVYTAHSVDDARFYLTEPLDLCIIDYMMPGATGFSLIAEIKAQPRARPVIVLMTAACATCMDRARAMGADADEYVDKVELAMGVDLRARVTAWLDRGNRE